MSHLLKASTELLKRMDLDSKLTAASLLLLFITWVIDLVVTPSDSTRFVVPIMVFLSLVFFLTITAASIKRDINFERLITQNQEFLVKDLPRLISERTQLSKEYADLGIFGVTDHRNDARFFELLYSAEHEICFLAVALYYHVDLIKQILPPLMAKKQLDVRFLILQPDSAFLKEKEREERTSNVLKSEIQGVEAKLRVIQRDAEALGYTGKIELRQYNAVAYCAMFIFDNKFVWYNPYLRGFPGKDLPVYEIKRNEVGTIDMYIKHFQSLWDDEKSVVIFDSKNISE